MKLLSSLHYLCYIFTCVYYFYGGYMFQLSTWCSFLRAQYVFLSVLLAYREQHALFYSRFTRDRPQKTGAGPVVPRLPITSRCKNETTGEWIPLWNEIPFHLSYLVHPTRLSLVIQREGTKICCETLSTKGRSMKIGNYLHTEGIYITGVGAW
jgi:hypothetical protein